MSVVFIGNYNTRRQQFRKIKVVRWLSLGLYLEEMICKKTKQTLCVLVCTTVLYRCMGLGLGCLPPYFSCIVAISFIGGGYRCTGRMNTCRKSLTNFIT